MKVLVTSSAEADFRVIPDSAVGRISQPWFVPDFGSEWRAHLALAVRVGRLGKGIAPRYFDRYVDAVTLLWVPVADGCGSNIDFMDGAVVCGQWLPPQGDEAGLLAEPLCRASQYATLKTGDVVAVMLPDTIMPVEANTHISYTLGNVEVLSFNIK